MSGFEGNTQVDFGESVDRTLTMIDGLCRPESEGTAIGDKIDEDGAEVLKKLTTRVPGKYLFKGVIGIGGMKEILRMKDIDTGRDVAMAVLKTESPKGEHYVNFIKEAKITANLEHPNIVPIHEIGLDEEHQPYFTMKLLRGESLSRVLDHLEKRDPEYMKNYKLPKLLSIFQKICDAISFAHARGIIHLDLKPDNILVGKYGDVLVLDWGLAKIIGEEKEQTFEDFSRRTMEGMTKGTPGYMSPEQAAGRNSKKDERTDIYSLGAILYSILTWKKPLDCDNVMEVIKKTIDGEIVSPSERAPERFIPNALEAVVKKAMAVEAEERYESVSELNRDIDAYLNGFTTSAEKAGWLKRGFRLVRRHTAFSVSILVIFLCFGGLGAYTLYQNRLTEREWLSVFTRDFQTEKVVLGDLDFRGDKNESVVKPWSLGEEGMKMDRFDWMWIRTKLPGNIRIELEFECEAEPDSLQVVFNGRMRPLKYRWQNPAGYIVQLGTRRGRKDIILKSVNGEGQAEVMASVSSQMKVGSVQKLIIEHLGEMIRFSVDGREACEVFDVFPPRGKDLNRVGVRTFSPGMWLRSLNVYRLALPVKATPLLAGDTLVEHGHFIEGIDTYLNITDTYGRSPVSEKALLKAFMTASTKDITNRDQILSRIREKIRSMFPVFRYRNQLLEVDALLNWRRGEYGKAVKLMPEIFLLNPDTGIVKQILRNKTDAVPADVSGELLRWIWRTKNLWEVDLAGMGIADIEPLRKTRLSVLNLSSNPVKNLDPLKNLPLRELDLSGCENITDLSPLMNVKGLQRLILPPNVENIDVLKKHPSLILIGETGDNVIAIEEFWKRRSGSREEPAKGKDDEGSGTKSTNPNSAVDE